MASLGGTLTALMGAARDVTGLAETTLLDDLVAKVLGWDLDSLALGEGPGEGTSAGASDEMAHPPVYRPLVDLSTIEDRHIIITYRLDRATIQELCAQLETDLMSTIRHPTGIPPLVQAMWIPILLTKKVCQIIVACCMLHNLALRRKVPFLQEDGPDGSLVAAVEPVDSEEEEAEEKDVDNRNNIIMQYFQ
ncbi:hypothetical protein NDU88_007963 [Pleurodeles waltl]|uniref:DDE Tnp4 domain-containing protein n=1 Tax=Pleurodeles waltl TaxID=8319 RepID=A0AAV7VVA5_PLEWA|nr:hypothetical protein NDU88_007963 [Pleurodeles waltl]